MRRNDTKEASNIMKAYGISVMSRAELVILEAIQLVEAMGADPNLTNAVSLLVDARARVAEYIDSRVKE
jgi:hypothetical protein